MLKPTHRYTDIPPQDISAAGYRRGQITAGRISARAPISNLLSKEKDIGAAGHRRGRISAQSDDAAGYRRLRMPSFGTAASSVAALTLSGTAHTAVAGAEEGRRRKAGGGRHRLFVGGLKFHFSSDQA